MCFFFSYTIQLFSAPPKTIPKHLKKDFTLNETIPVIYRYFDNSGESKEPYTYKKVAIDKLINKVKKGGTWYYGDTDTWLYSCLKKYPIKGKTVLIIGSTQPIYESVVLAYGGHPITVEYNQLRTDDPRLTIFTVEQFNKNPQKCDIVLSISSTEHDGLGRYGDPLNPFGDLEFMKKVKEDYLKKDGHLILAVPVGLDALVWNLHRVYGPKRLPMLLDGWTVIDRFGYNYKVSKQKVLDRLKLGYPSFQPVFYLSPN